MNRRILFAVAAMFVVAGAAAPTPSKTTLEINANSDGVSLRTGTFTATAQSLRYDETEGRIVLVGTPAKPATMNKSGKGVSHSDVSAAEITISLKTGDVVCRDVSKAASQRPK